LPPIRGAGLADAKVLPGLLSMRIINAGGALPVQEAELMPLTRSFVALSAAMFAAVLVTAWDGGPALAQGAKSDAKSDKPAAKPAPKHAAKPAAKPESKSDAKKKTSAKTGKSGKSDSAAQPTLLGQYSDWGAYTASPEGKKVCFVIAKPTQTLPDGVNRDPPYMFISTRPSDKVREEISIIMGYPAKPNVDAAAEVGNTTFTMYTQNDGAWVKNAEDEAKMVAALRAGSDVVVKGESGRGTKTTDTYSLKGLTQALDRAAQECK
jgi:hypothetical protein